MHDVWPAQYIEAIFQLSRIIEMQNVVHLSLQSYCVIAMLHFQKNYTCSTPVLARCQQDCDHQSLVADTCKRLQMRTLRERMKEVQNNHDAQVSIVLEKYQSLRRQVQQYHELLEAAIASTPSNDVDTASLSSVVKAITLR